MSMNAIRNRGGRLPCGGSPEAAATDRERRRDEYVDLRRRLAMSPSALAGLVGLSVGTVRQYPARSSPLMAPTHTTLAKMRAELVRRARQTLEEAEWRAEIEREIAELEVRWHVRQCAEEAEPLEDAACTLSSQRHRNTV